MERISERKFLVFILSFSFILRISFVFYLKNYLYFDDEFEYLKMVKNFLSGKGLIVNENFKSFRPPLYPLILSILFYLKFNFLHIRIFQSLISTFTVYIIYQISKEIFGKKEGTLSAIISSFYPFFIFYNGFLLTETFFLFFVVLSIFYLIKLSDTNGIISLKVGVMSGVAGLTRPTFQIFIPFVILKLLFLKENLKLKFRKVFFLVIGFCIVLSPWIIRNYKIFKKFIPGTTMGGWVFWEGNNPFSDGGPCSYFPQNIHQIEEITRDKLLYKMTIEVIKKNPKRFLYLLKNKFKRFWNIVPNAPEFEEKILYRIISISSFGILLPFFIIGFFVSFKNSKANFLHILIFIFTVFHMIYLASIRYRLPIEPFYIIFSVHGFFYTLDLFKKFFRPNTYLKIS